MLKISKEQLLGLTLGLVVLCVLYSIFFLKKQPDRSPNNPASRYSEKQIEQETVFADNAEDKRLYLQAIEHLEEKHYIPAYDILCELKPGYSDTVFGHSIILRLSDSIFLSDNDIENAKPFDVTEGLRILEEILDSNMYSPVLYETFRKWRAQTQALRYGMSNMSKIPNDEYNLKRHQVVKTIRSYLERYPDDQWAKIQLEMLLNLPDIGRGGPFGNNVLFELDTMYPI